MSKWDGVPPIDSLEELLRAKDIAKILDVSPTLFDRWRKEMELPYVRIGRTPFFSKTQVVHWMSKYQREVPDKIALLGRMMAERARTGRTKKN